ncbi:MAG: prepilin-type N-terminal cleavage/methylation domain-containing protein [Methylophilus sp.]
MKKQIGFTLIEMAIVLVIVGLLLGGVLGGQELINSAKVKSLATDFRKIPVYINTYQDKFKALPGDDAGATNHVGASANGDSDGLIAGAWDEAKDLTKESVLFWQHVRLAGLATGSAKTTDAAFFPTNAEGGRLGVSSSTPITGLSGQYYMCSKGIAGRLAKQLDVTMDNGTSADGVIQALEQGATVGTTAATAYDDNKTYIVCMAL